MLHGIKKHECILNVDSIYNSDSVDTPCGDFESAHILTRYKFINVIHFWKERRSVYETKFYDLVNHRCPRDVAHFEPVASCEYEKRHGKAPSAAVENSIGRTFVVLDHGTFK